MAADNLLKCIVFIITSFSDNFNDMLSINVLKQIWKCEVISNSLNDFNTVFCEIRRRKKVVPCSEFRRVVGMMMMCIAVCNVTRHFTQSNTKMLSRSSYLRSISKPWRRHPERYFRSSSSPLAAFSNFTHHESKVENVLDSSKVSAIAVAAFLSMSAMTQVKEQTCAAESAHPSPTPAAVTSEENFEEEVQDDLDKLPIYTADQVAENNGEDGAPVWMSYGGVVYDVTNFIYNHPGGSERILLAAGGAVEPYWHLYCQHFTSDLPMRLMEDLDIGKLDEDDQDAIDEQMARIVEENEDPYAHEPKHNDHLIVHGDQPMNAEVPGEILTSSYSTPPDYFYIRHHLQTFPCPIS